MIEQGVLQRVLSSALSRGSDFAEVFAEERETTAASLDDGRVEGFTSGLNRGAGIRVVRGETTGFAHTSDLSENGLRAAAAAAAAAAAGPEGASRSVSLEPADVEPRRAALAPSEVAKSTK